MKEEFFETAKREIEAAGLKIVEAECATEMAGSWCIVIENTPLMRLILDGHAGWLVLEEELAGILSGQRVWKDIWIGENLDKETIQRVVGLLAKKRRKDTLSGAVERT